MRHQLPVRGLLAAAVIYLAAAAPAQSEDDLVRARQLFNQGLTQEAASDWAGALATFQEVAKIKMTPQVRFHIARSKEHLGRLNEALGGYRLAEYEASKLGDKAAELLGEVQRAREELEKRVPKLVIQRGQGAQAAKVELDGVVLGEAQIGSEISIDPGPHVVAGILPGGKRFTQTVELKEGQTERLTLDAPDDLGTAAPGTAASEPPAAAGQSATLDASSVRPSGSALPWIIGGVGVASLAASAVFYTLKNDAEDELDSGCLGRTCPDTLQDTQSKGETYATLTGVTLGVGVVGVGVAAVLLLSGRSPANARTESGLSLDVRTGPRGASVELGGRF